MAWSRHMKEGAVPGSAPSDVCSQKSAVKDFDEQGGMKREGASVRGGEGD